MAYDPKDPADVELVEGIIAEATKGLTTKRDELLNEVKTLKKTIREGGSDPKALEKAEAEVERLSGELETVSNQLKTVSKDKDKLQKNYDSESSYAKNMLVENELTKALTSAKVTNTLMGGAKALFAGKVEVKVEGTERKLYVGDKPLAEAITAWSQSDEGKNYVSAGTNGGGGAGGGADSKNGAKVLSRAAFDALDQAGRASFAKEGGVVQG